MVQRNGDPTEVTLADLLRALEDNGDRQERAIADLRDTTAGAIAELRGSVAELRGSVAELRGSVSELRDTTRELTDGQARMEKAIDKLRVDVVAALNRDRKLEARVSKLETQMAKITKRG